MTTLEENVMIIHKTLEDINVKEGEVVMVVLVW